MCALLSIQSLYDLAHLPFDDTAPSYHDDGVEIAHDAALSKQRAHVRVLALHGFSYFTKTFHIAGGCQPVSFTMVIFRKKFMWATQLTS